MTLLTRMRVPAECRRVGKVLQAYLDAELPDADWVRAHLDVCRRCGLDERTFLSIKTAIAAADASGAAVEADTEALERLRTFARDLHEEQ